MTKDKREENKNKNKKR